MASSLLDYLADPSRGRASNRQDFDRDRHQAEAPAVAEDTVTLDKIASFMELDLRRVFVWLKAGLRLAAVLAVLGAVIAAAYGVVSPARYTVTTDVLIDPTNLQVINNDLFAPPGQVDGQLLSLGSRIRVMTSGNVMSRVVKELKLYEDPEFYKPPSAGLFDFLKRGETSRPDPELSALKALRAKVGISPDERSFIAALSVSAETTQKAITISNAIVSAFQAELAAADSEGANRAATALDDRLEQLKSDVLAAEERVEAYKRLHNLATGENGQLVRSQTISQLNSQIVAARSRVIDAQVTYNALQKAGGAPAGSQVAVSPALAELLQRAGTMEQQFEDQRVIFGERHPSIVRLKAQLSSVREQVRVELARATSAAKSELDKANAALAELTTRMTELEGSVFNDNQSQIELRELQRDAASKTTIYESFLSRARQITEREQINTNNIRVITRALPPGGRSWPPSTTVLFVLGAIGGFVLGLGLAIVRGIIGDLRHPPRTPADYS
ncbi:GumC family protein [Rhizobium puerariae]|uniref:GumC family protein n=1 Tax=Rhizobium puerariae TaxID=1585791 RepID=A0ABV6AJR9_9HYPH